MASTEQIKELRERTGAGIMDCRRALDEAGGNIAEAEKVLAGWGLARAAKKAGREARQGLVDAYIHAGGRVGALVEVNCETDFVARNDMFRQLAHDVAMQVAAMSPSRVSADDPVPDGVEDDVPLLQQAFIKDGSKTIGDLVQEHIARLGENIVIRRFSRFELGGQ